VRGSKGNRKSGKGARGADPDEPDLAEGGDEPAEWVPPEGRKPDGEEFFVTDDTLRAEFKARHWEEVRRMIDVLQADNKPVPDDVVRALIAMLAKDDLALDAVLALGGVKDDGTGRALAELASSGDASAETRQAALDALAKNGSKAALPFVQQLVVTEGLDPAIARHAYLALAGIGGREATETLLAELNKHLDDDLSGVILTALGKARDSDEPLAAAVRAGREKADKASLQAVLRAAQILGQGAGPELKAELLRTVESPEALAGFTDEVERQIVQATAMPPAVAAGILEPVLRHATTAGPLRDVALNALREARGDAAAKQIAAALARSTDETVRRELTAALGETGSTAATPTLVALLDDASADVRRAAARGLSQIRDPAAVKPLLAHLPKSPPDADFARNIVTALGTIGANESLAALEKLAASEEAFWRDLRPFVQNAVVRIKTGNPESLLLSTSDPRK
jgi:HEAT repeat protein